jgi:hypothetical protein
VAPYATVQDYADRHALTLSGAAAIQVQALLVDASALIRNNLPTGFIPDPELARALAVVIAHRSKKNPGGLRSRTLGEYSEVLGEAGGLYITKGDIDSLLPSEFGNGDAAYTVLPRDF